MTNQLARPMRSKLRTIAVAAGLTAGWVAVAQATMVPNALLNTYPSNYTADSRMATNSVNGFATRDSSVVSDNWMTAGGVTGTIGWSLNGRYAVDSIDVYNYREGAIPQNRGVSNLTLFVSNDYGQTYSSLGNYGINKAPTPVGNPNTPTSLSLGGIAATNFKFTINGSWGDASFVGLNEVVFNGTPASVYTQVPLTATATSTAFAGRPGSNAADGLTETTNGGQMWLSNGADNLPTITFSLNGTVRLDHLNIWNENETIGRGLDTIQIQLFDASMTSLGLAVNDADGSTTFALNKNKGFPLSAVEDTVGIRGTPMAAYFKIITLTNPDGGGYGGLDEVQAFAAVPEPSMVMLLGMGGLLLWRRRAGK